MKKYHIYDTTLRDGLQEYGREISINDAVKFAIKLDKMGFSWIEAGFASSNQNQTLRIKTLANLNLINTKIAAFGRTRGKNERTSKATDLVAIINSGAKTATLVGKVRLRDVLHSLQTDAKTNLLMVRESIDFMKNKGFEVVFDAEHFFDGITDDKNYSLEVIKTALEAGADWVTLCDTNGGSTIEKIKDNIQLAAKIIPIAKLGFHGHNDRGRSTTNAEIAFKCGITLIQGTINGYGERCGNTDLCQLIPNLYFDYKANGLKDGDALTKLTSLSIETSEYLNADHKGNHPWVGNRAGYTEAGMHTSGILRDKSSYIHADLSKVGNDLSFGLSEQSGKSSLAIKIKELGFSPNSYQLDKIHQVHLEKTNRGYCYAGADASLYVLVHNLIKTDCSTFRLKHWHVNTHYEDGFSQTEATILAEYDNATVHEVGLGNGPVDALNNALKKIVKKYLSKLKNYQLSDYRVKIVDPSSASAAKVRVIIEFKNNNKTLTTVGAHENIIEASWLALKDGIDYMRLTQKEC